MPPFRDDTRGSDSAHLDPDDSEDNEADGEGRESSGDEEQDDPDNSDIIMIEDYPSTDPGILSILSAYYHHEAFA